MDRTDARPPELPFSGSLIGGKYRIEQYIAEGGMGVIARGLHIELDEPVALKFLKPEVVAADPSGTVAGRFVREARATIKIKSEHVPRIFDVSTLDSGVPYIVMELLTGEDLENRVDRDGPLPIEFAVDVLLQAIEALAAAHTLGMVHRDIKPANIFLCTRLDGTLCAKVLDFGIAKLTEEQAPGRDHGLTGTNAVIGSPRYMAPEQMRSTRDVDARADIWAIGTSLYEVLTGTAPFDGVTLTQVCAAILESDPAPFAGRRSDVPAGLEAVVRRCLAKKAEDRFQSVAELAAALAPYGTPSTAHEAAARVARVLGKANATSSSRHSRPDLSSFAPSSTPSMPAATSAPSMTRADRTQLAWGENDGGPRAQRRWVLPVAIGGALVVVGLVLGGVALLRPTREATGLVATSATVAPPAVSSIVSGPPDPAAKPTDAPSSQPPPVTAKVDPLPNAKESPPTPAVSATTSAKRPTAEPTVTVSAGVSAKHGGHATANPSASSQEGLWDDRK